MRRFVSTALVATAMCGMADAQTTVTGAGTTGATSFLIAGTVGSACFITKPSDYTLQSTLYWTLQTLPSASFAGQEVTRFSVRCNVNTVYSLTWTRAGNAGIVGGPSTNFAHSGATTVNLFRNGVVSNISANIYPFLLRLLEGQYSGSTTGSGNFRNPRVAKNQAEVSIPSGTSPSNASTAAGSSNGQTYTFRATFNTVPSQALAAGSFSTTISVTLTIN